MQIRTRARRRNPRPATPAKSAAPACFHCGLPVPLPVADSIELDGLMRPMCCAGCASAAAMIIGAGFAEYYRSGRDIAVAADVTAGKDDGQ